MRDVVERVGRLQRLAVFEAAGRLGSFSAAADELGTTQPAVTRQIRELERALGIELFVRTANRSALSDIGRRLHGRVSDGFDAVEIGLRELTEHAATFVLASHPGVALQFLVPRIDGLTAALGDRELRWWMFDRDDEIRAGGYDAAIRVGTGNFLGEHAHPLFAESVVPVAAPSFAAQWGLGATSSADDVFRAPFVHMDDGDHPWMTWAEWLGHFSITLERRPGRVLFHNYPMVIQQALAGRGIALGWRHLVDDLLAGEALVVVGPEVRSHRGYYLTWPATAQDGAPSPEVSALRAWLDAEIDGQTVTG